MANIRIGGPPDLDFKRGFAGIFAKSMARDRVRKMDTDLGSLIGTVPRAGPKNPSGNLAGPFQLRGRAKAAAIAMRKKRRRGMPFTHPSQSRRRALLRLSKMHEKLELFALIERWVDFAAAEVDEWGTSSSPEAQSRALGLAAELARGELPLDRRSGVDSRATDRPSSR